MLCATVTVSNSWSTHWKNTESNFLFLVHLGTLCGPLSWPQEGEQGLVRYNVSLNSFLPPEILTQEVGALTHQVAFGKSSLFATCCLLESWVLQHYSSRNSSKKLCQSQLVSQNLPAVLEENSFANWPKHDMWLKSSLKIIEDGKNQSSNITKACCI